MSSLHAACFPCRICGDMRKVTKGLSMMGFVRMILLDIYKVLTVRKIDFNSKGSMASHGIKGIYDHSIVVLLFVDAKI